MQNSMLTKQSTENEIVSYFRGVRELSLSGKEFPVNLDEVWPLVYERKDYAVKELKKTFYEDVDYKVVDNQSLLQKAEQVWGGQNKVNYYLSLPCMEYFIARKVRPVFEVYRRMFHKTMDALTAPSYQIEDPIKRAQAWIEEQKKRIALESENKQLSEQNAVMLPKVRSYEQVINTPQTEWLKTTQQVANEIGMSANKLNKLLIAAGIIYKAQNGEYLVTANYAGWNLHCIVSYPISENRIKTYIKWTERGRLYIHALNDCNWNKRKAFHFIKEGRKEVAS